MPRFKILSVVLCLCAANPAAHALAPSSTIAHSPKAKIFSTERWFRLHEALERYLNDPALTRSLNTMTPEQACDMLEVAFYCQRWLPGRYPGRKMNNTEEDMYLNDYLEELTQIEGMEAISFDAQKMNSAELFKKMRQIESIKQFIEARWFYMGHGFAAHHKKDERDLWGKWTPMRQMLEEPHMVSTQYPQHGIAFEMALGYCYRAYADTEIRMSEELHERLIKNPKELQRIAEVLKGAGRLELITAEDNCVDWILGMEAEQVAGEVAQNADTYSGEQYTYQGIPYYKLRELFKRCKLGKDDVFYDLGSGNGRAVFFTAMTTDVSRAVGIELVRERVDEAERVRKILNLEKARFICANCKDADFQDGTAFFMFNPFFPSTLSVVGEKIIEIAKKRKITILSGGACNDYFLARPDLFKRIDMVDFRDRGSKFMIFESIPQPSEEPTITESPEQDLMRLEAADIGVMDGESLIRWYARLATLRHKVKQENKLAILQSLSARIVAVVDKKQIREDVFKTHFFFFRRPEWTAPILIPAFPPPSDVLKKDFILHGGDDPADHLAAWIEQKKQSQELLLVAVNGGPGAGKTESAKALEEKLKSKGLRVLRIEMDNYLKSRTERYAKGAFGLEKYDLDRLKRDLESLERRQPFRLPKLLLPSAEIGQGDWVHPEELDVIFFDGEFTFAMQDLRDHMHVKLFVDEIDPVRFFQVGENNLKTRGYKSWEDVAWRFATAQQLEFDALVRNEIGRADVLFRPHRKELWLKREEIPDVVREVLRHFPVGEVYQINRISRGKGPGRTFEVISSNGKYLLKMMGTQHPDLLEAARFEAWAVNELMHEEELVAPMIPSNAAHVEQQEDRFFVRAADGNIYFLYPWLDGDEISEDREGEYSYAKVTPQQAHNLTVGLARMHRAWDKKVPKGKRGPRPMKSLQPFLEKLEKLKARLQEKQAQDSSHTYTHAETFFLKNADFLIEQTISSMKNLPAERYEKLPKGIIHGDCHPHNAIFRGDALRAIFDWDHLRVDVRALDFFCGHFQELTESKKYNTAELKRVVHDYRQFMTLSDEELAALPELARLNSLYNVLFLVRPEGMHEGKSYAEQLEQVDPLEQSIWLLDHHEWLFKFFNQNLAILRAVAEAKKAGEFDEFLTSQARAQIIRMDDVSYSPMDTAA